MLAIIELIFFLLFMPYILFGVLLAHIATLVTTHFEPKLFLFSAWFMLVAVWLSFNQTPDDRPFVSVVDAIAQSHILGLPTPLALFGVGTILAVVSAVVAVKRRRTV